MPFIAASLTPLPGRPTLTMATSCFGLMSTSAGSSLAIAAWTSGRVDVVGLDDDHRVVGLGRERLLDLQVRLDDRLGLGVGLDARELGLHAQRGDGEGDERAAGDDDGDDFGWRMTRSVSAAPHAGLAGLGLTAADERQAALLDLVAERGERRRAARSASR